MAPPPQQPLVPPGGPRLRYAATFDPWNSASTGHQRADGAGAGTMWREWRNTKLGAQYLGKPVKGADRRPAAEGRVKAVSVADMLVKPGTMRDVMAGEKFKTAPGEGAAGKGGAEGAAGSEKSRPRGIFDGLVVYVNGSTHPFVSDHKLKQILAQNGACTSLHLARRRVTHVILGRPGAVGCGAGGGLAAGKLEREVRRVGGCGVKYVGVEWVLESLEAGRRLPEARFANLKIARSGQGSVYSTFAKSA